MLLLRVQSSTTTSLDIHNFLDLRAQVRSRTVINLFYSFGHVLSSLRVQFFCFLLWLTISV